jgi:tRNA A-37 threonylcarbamoyl transferase component Bud32
VGFGATPTRFLTIQIARNFNRTPLPLAIHAIAAGTDDFLWIAADQGLFRFDGTHFHLVDREPLTQVAVTTDGWVWGGGDQGLITFRQGERRKLLSVKVSGLVARGKEVVLSAGGVWRGTLDGLSKLGVESNGSLALDRERRVWFGCGQEVCALPLAGPLQRMGSRQGVPAETWLNALADDEGTVWVSHRTKSVSIRNGYPVVQGTNRAVAPPDYLRFEPFRSHDGRIWLPGGPVENGRYSALDPPVDGMSVDSFAEDRLGNLWMGSRERGISLLSSRKWVRSWRRETFPAGSESISRTPSGRLLAATAEGFSELDAKGQSWRHLPGKFGTGHAWAAVEGRDGNVWTMIQDVGIFRLNRENQQTAAIFQGSMKDIDFRCFLRDRTGQIWVGAKRGLYRIDESGPPRLVEVPLPAGAGYAGAFAIDASGQEWLGYEGGIARLENGAWKRVVPATNLLSPRIRSLAVAPGPVFWISYRAVAPFSRIASNGSGWKRRDFPLSEGYSPDATSAMLVDRRGWVWRGTTQGLFVSDSKHLAAHDWVKFGQFHNLPSESVAPFGLFEDRDGSIWVSADDGVAHVEPDPSWFAQPRAMSPPRVSAVRWNGKENLWPGTGNRLASAQSPLEMDVSQWPEPLPGDHPLQFRLMPKEKEWKTAADSTIRFESLPSGRYRLELRAADEAPTAAYEFEIASVAFGWWWPLGGAAGLAGAGWWGWQRFRNRRLEAEYWAAKQAFVSRDDPAQELRVGETIASKYVLEERIGEGGFSSVYRARDTATEEVVAVKILQSRDEFLDSQRRRFEREIESLRRIDHPGIVHLLDSGWVSQNEPFLVMSYVAGPTLRTVMSSGPVRPEQFCKWMLEMGEALGEAHRHAVLHRDLKPENIMIEGFGRDVEHIVVVDFGAALVKEQLGQKGTTVMLVSVHYSAPERTRGSSSTASDVYSLAAIAFEMLTGVRFATLDYGDQAELRRALAHFPPDVVRLLADGTNVLPAARPQDIRAFTRELVSATGEDQN